MIFTNEDIAEFRQICEEEGETVTVEQAEEGVRRLDRLYELLLMPTPDERRRANLIKSAKKPAVREALNSLKRGGVRGQR